MISFVRGEVSEIGEGLVVVDTGHIGYEIFVPSSVIGGLPPVGGTVKLYTWFQVREDGMALYGFLTRDDLDTFKLLLKVSGVGPKAAMNVLSAMTPDEFRFAVLADDVKSICAAPGLGPKTAKKIILELKDKFDLGDAFEKKIANDHGADAAPANEDAKSEAIQALVALGYSSADAFRAVKSLEDTQDMDAGAILKAALKVV